MFGLTFLSSYKVPGTKYTVAQVTKALTTALTALVGILGILATAFATGPLQEVGTWAGVAALAISPYLVFITKMERYIGDPAT